MLVTELPWRDPFDSFAALAGDPHLAFLDSAASGDPLAEISYLCPDPLAVLRFDSGTVGDPFAALATWLDRHRTSRGTGAKLFFRKALKTQKRPPRVIALDGYAASHRAVRELPEENVVWNNTKLRSSKYLNNLIGQDHRGVKARIGPMLGIKRFRRAKVTIAGIELLHRIRKNQFDLSKGTSE